MPGSVLVCCRSVADFSEDTAGGSWMRGTTVFGSGRASSRKFRFIGRDTYSAYIRFSTTTANASSITSSHTVPIVLIIEESLYSSGFSSSGAIYEIGESGSSSISS